MDEAELVVAVAAAEERVRRSVAQWLHDDVQQHLHGLRVQIGLLEAAARRNEPIDPAALAHLARRADDAVDSLRYATRELVARSGVDLTAALFELVARAQDLHGLEIEVQAQEGWWSDLSPERVEILVAAARELLFNVAKHADTDLAELRLERDAGCVVLTVADDGAGDTHRGGDTGLGLNAVRERVAAWGGTLEVSHPSGGGTTATVRMPTTSAQSDVNTALT